MLSIAKLSPSGEAGRGVRYYIDHIANSRDDYYTGSGEAPGVWVGGGCRSLGLKYNVYAEDYLAVMEGRHPGTGEALVAPVEGRLPGYDLTFSAPKSVSLLWAFGNERTAEIARAAHDHAVTEALKVAEEEACFVRRGHAGRYVLQGEGLVAAAFRHRSSRAGDPHLHTHVVVANLVEGPDGRFSAPDGRPLYVWAAALGAVYRAHLRSDMARLGMEWEPRANGTYEVAGIAPEILTAFSRRRAEIQAEMAKAGTTSARASEVAQRRTRLRKEPALASAPDDALRARWAERLGQVRINGRQAQVQDVTGARAHTRWGASPKTLDEMAAELVAPPDSEAPARSLTAHASTFSRRDVVRALANGVATGAKATEVMAAAERLVASEAVVPLLPFARDSTGASLVAKDVIRTRDGRVIAALPADRRYSTPELLGLEADLIDAALAQKATGIARVEASALTTALSGSSLSPDQARVVGRLCRSGDGVEVVIGPPGSGKTSALAVARQAWEADGYRVIGAALAARAAIGLQEGSGIASSTVHSLLADLDRPGSARLARRSVVVIDEAGVVGSRMLGRLLAHTSAAGAKLVLVGDHHQLPEVDAGGAFRGLGARLGALALTGNWRQAGAEQDWERRALDFLRQGDVDAALASYRSAGRLTAFKTPQEAYAAVVAHWWEIHCTNPGAPVAMMASTNAEVAELNTRARVLRRAAGELGPDHYVDRRGTAFAVGDRVVATDNDRRIDVWNGTFGTVTAINRESGDIRIRTDAGPDREIPALYLAAGHLSHGYATTIHKAQGATVDYGLYLASESAYREAGYVALSRGRVENHLYATVGENPRWEIGHGPDGAFVADPTEALVASLSRSKAQALACEHTAGLTVTGVETARKVWEAHDKLGWELRDETPPDRRDEWLRAKGELARRQESRKWVEVRREQAKEDLENARSVRRRDRRYLVPQTEGRVREAEHDVALVNDAVRQCQERVAELESAVASREAWLEANQDRLAAYRELGERLGDWERRLGRVASFARPAYLTDVLGYQPTNYTAAREWEAAAGAIEGYRRRWGITDKDHAFGDRPDEDSSQRRDYGRADAHRSKYRHAEAARCRERGLERDAGMELVLELHL